MDLWSSGCFVPLDVLSFVPSGRFFPTDVLSDGCYVSCRYVSGHFFSGRFVWAPLKLILATMAATATIRASVGTRVSSKQSNFFFGSN
jgi:hypothetical protein